MNENKALVRKAMKKTRGERYFDAEDLLIYNFVKFSFDKYGSFFVYNSFSSEASTKKLIEYLLNEGKKVFLPRVNGDTMQAVAYSGSFTKGAFGIEEPAGEEYLGDIDVCVLPLLAVDKNGVRLGYGGGYYDKFLNGKKIIKIAYAFDFQVVEELECEPFDVKVDIILTEKRVMRVNGGKNEG